MRTILCIILGGAAGALARYLLSGAAQRLFGPTFPLGTMVVNLLGCLLFGLVWGLFEGRVHLPPELRMLLLTGFLGAFTTFSTYIFETGELVRSGQYVLALVNVAGQTLAGLALIFAGLALAKVL